MARTRKSTLSRTSILQTPSIRLLDGGIMRGVKRTLAVAALVIVTAAGLRAHQSQRPFRTAIDLVNFGVTVVDKAGKPVTGLTADDFQILENGKPQTLKFFVAGQPDEA